MLYGRKRAFCSEYHNKHVTSLCGQKEEFLKVETWWYMEQHSGFNGKTKNFLRQCILQWKKHVQGMKSQGWQHNILWIPVNHERHCPL